MITALDRRYARTDERPIAAMMFLGPTGVGKTELAKTIVDAFTLRGQTANLVRIDCSTLGSQHDGPAYMLGSPAGYVGYKDPPAFDSSKFASPLSNDVTVLLLDEIEKAAPDTWKTLMPVLDEGHVKLRNGETTSFANTIIIATSNVGAADISSALGTPIGFATTESGTTRASDISSVARKAFKEHFKHVPEFAGRFGTPIVFEPHTKESLARVFIANLDKRNYELRARFGVEVRASDAVRDRLVDQSIKESHLGARPLVHAIEDEIMSIAGRYMASGHLSEGGRLLVFTSTELADRQGSTTDVDRLIFGMEYDKTLKILETAVVKTEPQVTGEEASEKTESESE